MKRERSTSWPRLWPGEWPVQYCPQEVNAYRKKKFFSCSQCKLEKPSFSPIEQRLPARETGTGSGYRMAKKRRLYRDKIIFKHPLNMKGGGVFGRIETMSNFVCANLQGLQKLRNFFDTQKWKDGTKFVISAKQRSLEDLVLFFCNRAHLWDTDMPGFSKRNNFRK